MMATALSPTVVVTSVPRQTLHLSSNKTNPARETTAIHFRDCHTGIGIKVIGGTSEGISHGIFIKRLLKDKMAMIDGRLKVGDQVLRINGRSLEGISYADSLQILRDAAATGQATLVITRDDKSSREFTVLMEDEFTTASESSRRTSPLGVLDTSRSSESTLQSESSESLLSSPKNNQSHPVHAMNNSGLTRTLSNNSAHRQDIKRLANFFSNKQHGLPTMSSTPHDVMKAETNQQRNMAHNDVTSLAMTSQQQSDSVFAQQLLTSIHTASGSQPSSLHRDRSLSALPPPVNPDMRCSYEKLDTALRFLGLNITESQRSELRSMLHVDKDGLISYDQFVQVIKNMFQEDLKEWEMTSSTLPTTPLQSAHAPVTSLPPTHKPAKPEGRVQNNTDLVDEVRQLQKENSALRKQIHNLSKQLNDQSQLTCNAEKDLHKFRVESQQALEEATSLREKLVLAAESQKIASVQEQEFERVIEGLEQEIRVLKEKEARQMESTLVRKKLAVLGSQLRKSEESRKTYQVATQKLMDYCQNMHDVMSGQSSNRPSPQHLASEALETMSLVRTLLERDPLPFGWEECYDEDGARYFINHVTQETSWQHPITRQTSSSVSRIH